ncbi:MAG: glycosyltransferase family 4 protein [Bacteroidota bacterium]
MSKKRKICFILPHFHLEYSGGAEIQCYYLAKELLKREWEVHYIRESSDQQIKQMEGITVHGIPKRKAYLKWQNKQALIAKMKDIQADFWYNRATLAYLPFITQGAKEAGGKVAFAFSRDSQFNYAEFRQTYKDLKMKVYSTIEQFFFFRALKKTDRLLVQTQQQKQLLHQALSLSADHIYNAHPVEPHASDQPIRKPLILWIARIKHFKRPELLLEIARRLKDQPYEFRLIGKLTGDSLSQRLVHEAQSLPNVELMGHQTSEQVHAALREAKALISTSDVEGFSNTFIEAWLRGVPVLSLNVDPDSLIQEHGLGHVEPDLDTFCTVIQQLMDAPEQWSELSERCEMFAQNHFDIQKAVDKLETVLCQQQQKCDYTISATP